MRRVFAVTAVLMLAPCVFASNWDAWNTKKQEMDAACETARESQLTSDRDKYVNECVENGEKKDRAACEKFYADYGAGSPSRPPLYYDLPECRRAFEHRQSRRNSSSRAQ